MPDWLVGSRGFQLAVKVNWKREAFSKNNAKYVSVSVPVFFRVGAAGRVGMLGERIFYIITLITAAGVAMGEGKEL
jgi:hypothetical protein